jgi:ABC-type oligopeptide transport system substrate-binding subunit/actin-like ATPase involved in cell morphogenesis
VAYELGVDLGTTYTAAAVRRDGRVVIASLGTRTLEMPSVAFLQENGEVLVGETAERRSFTQSDRFAREFKRRIGDPTPILLGGTPFSAHALTARLLRTVVTAVADRGGGPPGHTVVTCPASWGAYKRDLLEQAIHQADIGPTSLATEPEAAAVHYASTTRVGPGELVAVYDLGGGTFDATVLRAAPDGGFELLGVPQGLEHLGGVQFDDAVFTHVTRQIADRLAPLDPDDPATLSALGRLRRECVEAKEALSSDIEARILVTLPNWQTEITVSRQQFEDMIRPALLDTVETLRRTLRSADLRPGDVTAVLLVGGSSRIPLVAELVSRELGRPTAVDIHPKHAVALGAARLAASAAGRPLPNPVLLPPPPPPPTPADGVPIVTARQPADPLPGESPFDQTRDHWRRRPATPAPLVKPPEQSSRVLLVAGAVGAAVVLGGALLTVRGGGGNGGGGDGGTDVISAEATAATEPCIEAGRPEGGVELVDYSVFAAGVPDDLDPARDVTPASAQIVDALYDGLTEVDARDPDHPRVRLQVAESYESNDDATQWTFTLRQGLRFSNDEPVVASSFVRAWERATDPRMQAGDTYLFGVIDGGWEKLDGSADRISGLEADDDARTLRVRLDVPYVDFPALVAFPPFMPLPAAVEELDRQDEWDEGVMIGNGPFAMDAPLSGRGVSLVRNRRWNGTCYDDALGLPEQPAVATLRLRTSANGRTGYEAVTSGDAHVAAVPARSRGEARESGRHTFEAPLVSTSFLAVNWDDPLVGGPENALLRQAVSLAVDRQSIADEVFGGTATPATGLTPPVVPGFAADLCDHCGHEPDAARAAFEAWQDEGHRLDDPLRVQSAAPSGGSDPVVSRVVDALDAAGIPAVEDPLGSEDYLALLRDGACQICLVSRTPSFLSAESVLYELFHSDSIGRSNYGRLADEQFDDRVYEARSMLAAGQRAELYQAAERRLLNDTVAAIPLLWSGAPYTYAEGVEPLPVDGLGRIVWEQVS